MRAFAITGPSAGALVQVPDPVAGPGEVLVAPSHAVDPTLTCGACYRCRRGQSNHCEGWGAIGDTVNGGLAEKAKRPDAPA